MKNNQSPASYGFFSLLQTRRFLPLFVAQFLGAFSDNTFRSSLIVMITYNIGISQGYDPGILVTIVGGIFILPFLLFSSISGQVADKYEKSRLVVIIKGAEIFVVSLAIFGFYKGSLFVLLGSAFLTSVQSTFLGPLKYSLLPIYLKEEELIAGNGLVESSTFLSILLGTIVGGFLIGVPKAGLFLIAFILISVSVMGWASSFFLLKTKEADPALKINWNLPQETIRIVRAAMKDRVIFLTILGISWFWLVGAVFLAQIATYGKEVVGGNENVASLFLTTFALGIGLGSLLCHHFMKGEISARLVPWAALGMTFFIGDLVYASKNFVFVSGHYIGVMEYLRHPLSWRIEFDMLMVAVCGGLYTVPLYALLQQQAKPQECSRIIAANNIINSFFMVVSSVLTIILLSFKVHLLGIFLIVGTANMVMMMRLSRLVPESILQLFAQMVFKLLYQVEVKGLENYRAAGKRVLIIANHTSFLDSALIFAFIPEKISFAIYTQYVKKWWINIIASGVNKFPVDPLNPMATRSLIEHLKQDRKCAIFPEGRISVTGSLMKVYDGPGMVADMADATILPIRVEGAEHSYFSRMGGKIKRRLFPKITLTILPPQKLQVDSALKGRARREVLSNRVYDIMSQMLFESSPYKQPLFLSVIEAAKRFGMSKKIATDINREPLTYRNLLMRSYILSRLIEKDTAFGERVGMLLPTSNAGLLTFFALHSKGRVPSILNFSSGVSQLIHACKLAQIRILLTSRRFVKGAQLEETIEALSEHVEIFYLEDLRENITISDKLYGIAGSYFPELFYKKTRRQVKSEDPAVVLFTSGSEGHPKGVVLSHQNINANRYQMAVRVDFNAQDIILNALPMFHSFGLTVGTLLPVLSGVSVFLYPSPLHYRIIPVVAYDINATIFLATDTFLSQYAHSAHPYDFYSVRYIFAGAEKLKQSTRDIWIEKFGISIYEGYGATEAAPVISVNTPMHNKIGSVGRLIPSVDSRIEPVEGIDKGGRLLIKGPNVMLGYINPKTGKVDPTSHKGEKGWYNTGDIVSLDQYGYATIQGRLKRFAKVGGEMISLLAVEEALNEISLSKKEPFCHAVFACPDDLKGEQLVLLTTSSLTRPDIREGFKAKGLSELMLPKQIIQVKEIPQLLSGKVDFMSAQKLLESSLSTSSDKEDSETLSFEDSKLNGTRT